jgi:hypothetical protein
VNDAGERRETGRSPVFDPMLEMVGDVMFDVVPEGCGCLAEGLSAGCLVMVILATVPIVPLLLR